jgi:RNA polymerase sigma-70 factor (ECF subfamily)
MDSGSIEALYRAYGPSVLRRAQAILREEQAARDALQEVFVRVLKGGYELRDDASPMTWLYRVTTNYCLNVLRDRGRRDVALSRNGPANAIEAPVAEDRYAVSEILARVPNELAEVAIYYYVDQMNQDEIAEMMGVSRRTIGNRLEAFREAARMEVGALARVVP